MTIHSEFDEKLERGWNTALSRSEAGYPFCRYDWHKAWSDTIGKNAELTIGETNGCILPFMVAERTLRFTGGEEVSDYLDVIGPEKEKPAALAGFLQAAGNRFDRILLRNIPHDSGTVSFFRTHPEWMQKVTISEEDTTPTVILPDTFNAYLTGLDRKYRHELRRKTRRFREQFPGVSFVSDNRTGIVPERIFELMLHHPDKKTFLTAENREFFRAVTRLPFVRTDRLVDGNNTIAFKIILEDKDTLFLYNSGFDPSYQGAGYFLTASSISRAVENGIRKYNFLQGGERYKYEFGAGDFAVMRIETAL